MNHLNWAKEAIKNAQLSSTNDGIYKSIVVAKFYRIVCIS